MGSSPAENEQLVRAALEDILGWQEMSRSPQLGRFLHYIVEAKLDGREASIKAYAIAVDVFGRDGSFDPQSDPIVRVQARRLRRLLDRYYEERLNRQPVRISLPLGRYVPEFEALDGVEPPRVENKPPPVRPASPRWGAQVLVGLFFGAALAGLVFLWASWTRPPAPADAMPTRPHVKVAEFQNLADQGARREAVGGLALELVTDLGLFENIDVAYAKGGARTADAEGDANAVKAEPADAAEETLSGVARISGSDVQYGVILSAGTDQSVGWTYTVSLPVAKVGTSDAMDMVSRELALVLGSQRGPLHAQARQWVAAHPDFAGTSSIYLCRVLFDLYRDSAAAQDAELAGKCLSELDGGDGATGFALAARAALLAEEGAGANGTADAGALADKAVDTAPTSSFVWEQAARVREIIGRSEDARSAYASALQLNPANSDALAAYGRMLAMGPDWREGAEMAMTAMSGTPSPPPWYFAGPALDALRVSAFADAERYGAQLAMADRELGPVVAVVAGANAGDGEAVNRYLPQVLDYQPFRSAGILVKLRQRLSDAALVASIGDGLRKAGVPAAALEGPF